MELLAELQRARLRELLARLDRIATVDRGHRAGLHLYDHALFEQYLPILIAWENEVKAVSIRPVLQSVVSVEPLVGQSAIGQADPQYVDAFNRTPAVRGALRGQGSGI